MSIYTSDNTMLTKLRKLVAEAPDTWRVIRITNTPTGEITSVTVEGPKDLLTLRTQKSTRALSEEQRKAAAERLAKIRANKQSNTP